MVKCRDCVYYKKIDTKLGSCYGVKIKGDRDHAKESDNVGGSISSQETHP